MLVEIYMQVLDMTRSASVVILIVILARILLKKVPKVFSYAIWSVVLFRLLCPVTFQAPVSIIPEVSPVAQTYSLVNESISIIGASEAAYQAVGDVLNGGLGIQHIRTTEKDSTGMVKYVTTDWWEVWILFGQYVWGVGIAVMLFYSVFSYLKLQKKLIVVVLLRDNIYIADDIKSPFVIGFVRPKIYLPCGLSEKEQRYIILHEQHHIRRFDHIIKALAFLALCIHWFNPLVWVAFALANKDMEMSCDEAVVRKMGDDVRADYSASLLALATGQRIIAGTPLAFGEGDTKERIKNLANLRKPVLWVGLVAVVGCSVLVACLLTNPTSQNTMLMGAEYLVAETLYRTSEEYDFTGEAQARYCITADYCLYELDGEGTWTYIGAFEPYTLDAEELEEYTVYDDGWRRRYHVGKIVDSYILRLPDLDNHFYIAFQTKRGDTLLGYGWEDISERGQGASDDTGLKWLYRLDSKFEEIGRTGAFLERSLAAGVGSDVDIYYTWMNAKLPGYIIVGFMAGDADFNEKTDMGFAVFYHNSDESGYHLLDYHVYEDAALAENGIYLCEHPAIANMNGEMRSESTFDVVLINNDNVAKVTRIYEYENGKTETVSESFINAHNMVLFSWEYDDAGCRVWQYFFDENGNIIDYSGEIKREATQSMMPTTANMQGAFDGYLYVPLDGEVYRYERIAMNTENVTIDKLLDEFTESAEPENVRWEVYSIKEFPDYSAVLAVAGADYECLYQYSPSKRSAPDALQRAKEDGCVIMENGDVTFGKQIWQDFVKATEEGKSAFVQVAHYYTLDPESCSEQYYEAYKEDYPVLYIFDLTYDGDGYTLCWNEGNTEYVRDYQYLMHYTDNALTATSAYDTYVRYVLTNDNTVTWEDLYWGMLSSQFGDYIEHYSIYTDLQ